MGPLYSSAKAATCMLLTMLFFAPTHLRAQQGASTSRELYDNDALFNQLSSAFQTKLELRYGKKNQKVVAPQLNIENKSLANGPRTNTPGLSALANTLVNDATADATSQDTQSETGLVLGSGSSIIAGFNDSGSFIGGASKFTGFSTSANSGSTFTDGGTLPTNAWGDAGDPVLARSTLTGTVFLSTLGFITADVLPIFRSSNNGVSWQAPVNGAPPTGTGSSYDKEWITVDNFAGTGQGNVYMAWRNFGATNNGILFTRSTDDGATWGPSGGLNLVAGGGQGAFVAVAPSHDVYTFWYHSLTTPQQIRVRRSTDRGVSFGAPVTITTLKTRGVNGDFGLGFRSNAFPQAAINPATGYLYVIYPDSVGGVSGDRCSIYFTTSTDNGTTWSSPTALTFTNDQFNPAIAVRPDGAGLSVSWYDRQSDPANFYIERWGRNASISGTTVTWGPAFKISEPFGTVYGVDPVVNSVYMGDYDQMAADNNYYYTTWGDNRDQSIAVPSRKNANVRFAKYPSGVFLDLAGYQISGGNGNGIIDASECNSLQVSLINNGALSLTGVTGTLTSLTPGVKVFSPTQSFSDMVAGGIGSNAVPFTLSTERSFLGGTSIILQLNVSSSGGLQTFNFPVATGGYNFATGATAIVPGTTDIGNHGDDQMTPVPLPFPIKFYNQTFTTAYASSNGNIQFESSNASFTNPCPPVTFFKTAIMPYFDDLTLFTAGDGIFTLVQGSAPNRVFNMEWRAHTFASPVLPVNFEVQFFENNPNFVRMIYGTVANGGNSATVGMQFGTTYFSSFSCNTASLSNGMLIDATFPSWGEGNGTCLPPTMAVSPASLSFTVPQNGSSGNVVRVSNTAPIGNDVLNYSVGDYTGSLVLANGQTIPVEMRRLMGVFPEKMLQDEAKKEAAQESFTPRKFDETTPLRPEETAVGQKVPGGAGLPSSNPIAVAPYVETFESGNFNGWFNEGLNASAQVVSGTAGEGAYSFQTGASVINHFTSIRQDWSGGVQPSSISFLVRPSTTTNNQGYAVFTTGAPTNTEVIWFFCDNTGKFYANLTTGGDNSFVYTANTWYRVEFRNISWTTKTFDYYVNGTLIKAGISMRNSGTVTNIDRVHLYNFDAGATAQWDGIRVGGAGGDNAWLNEPTTGGAVLPGAFAQVLVNVNAAGLSPGGYTGTLVISGNDPAHASLTVPVSLTVIPAVTPTEFAVVSNINDNTINIIDVASNSSYGPYLSGSLGTGGLTDVEVTPDHHTAAISSFGEHRIYFVDVSNPAVPAVPGNATFASMGSTEDLAVTADGKFCLATGGGGNTFVGVVNVATRTVVQELNLTPRTAEAVAVAPNGTVLVADYPNNQVHVLTINPTTGILTDPAIAITVGTGPVNVAISPDGQTALVSNFFGNSVSVLRITGVGAVSLISTLPNMNFPAPMAFRPDGARAYVVLNGPSPDSIAILQVTGPGSVINTGLRAPVISDVAGGYYGVDGMAIAYSGNWAYVGDASSGGVTPAAASAVNLTTNAVGFSPPTGSIPTGVAIGGEGGPAGTSFTTILNVFDNCNTIGLAIGTGIGLTPNYDAGFDQFAPPAPPVGAFDARLRVTSPANDFLKDYRGPNTGVKVWDVYYAAATGCGNVTLAWNIAQLPATGSFRLVDAFTGTLVNIDMRSQSFYTDTFPLGHLQIVYSLDASFTKSVAANWNLLGLPNVVTNPYYLGVFPTATPGTLFGFNGSYFLTDTLKAGIGYWLRFGAPASQPIPGVFRNSTSNTMALGWNLIAGPSCNIPLSSVSDPGGIIIPGTLFGFNGAYVLSDTVRPGNGYWLRTTSAGSISMLCGSTTHPLGKTVAQVPDVSSFPSVEVADASHATQRLFTSVKLENGTQMLSFSMPPVPPAGNFDARFMGDFRATEADGGMIEIQSANFPITVTCPNTPANSGVEYVVVEMLGNQEGKTYKLSTGSSIQVQNLQVNMLRLTTTSSEIPASFAVDQNYPNPFNPTTEIRYALPQDAYVTVTIFNALGQTVKTLVGEQQKAGYYHTRWEADNNVGQKVGSGVYFYKVSAGQFNSTKKMLLLK